MMLQDEPFAKDNLSIRLQLLIAYHSKSGDKLR